ncbi:hypothetical protein [Actinomadura sp. 9N407]|uniref:hypothetical protein n=1 Tax=Actinomadura sp. 9N407 TaxID=3375154 RepID=UPI0037AB8DEB
MPYTLPLVLPDSLVDAHQLDLTAPYSAGWGVHAYDVVAAPNGETYALYSVSRYTPTVDRKEPDPAIAHFTYRVITRYSPDGVPQATALCCPWAPNEWASAVANGNDMTLCVLPDGLLTANAHPDRTTFIAPDLSEVVATYETEGRRSFEEFVPGDPFAGSISTTPSGRLLCVTSEYGVRGYGNSLPNIVGLADGALTPDHKPSIRAIASLDPEPARQTEDDLRPHVRFEGRPVGLDNRPRPSLTETFEPGALVSRFGLDQLGRPAPLSDDLFVVPAIARRGSRGGSFVFALVNDEAEVTGPLQGMDKWGDSPFTGECFNVAAGHGHAFHLNRYGLYAWDSDGQLQTKLSTQDKAFKPLKNFTLMTCSPAGELLLVHARQHLVLRVPVPGNLDQLGTAVEAALRGYTKERTALKNLWAPTEWHWVQPDAQAHRL